MKITSLDAITPGGVSHNPEIEKRVMLQAGDLPHLLTFAQARFRPGQVADRHVHADKAELFWVEAGTGEIEVDTAVFLLAPGVCVAVEAGEFHEIRNTGTADLVLTYLGLQV